MNPRPSLREALARADVAELDETADALGREIGQAIAVALDEAEKPPLPERYKPNEEEERERMLDEALSDASKVMERQRNRLGRRITSRHDAMTMRKIFELLRSMAGPDGGCDSDSSFQ